MKIRKLNFSIGTSEIGEWIEGNPFKTQLFNSASMSFPIGEAYFIRSVKKIQELGLITSPELLDEIAQFSAQEALHSYVHRTFNNRLAEEGLTFSLQKYFEKKIKIINLIHNAKTQLSITMAYEHLTSALSYANLKYEWGKDIKDENIRKMWDWHSAEEIEHNAVAYHVYEVVKGGYLRRLYGMVFTLTAFTFDYTVQTMINLWKTQSLFKIKTMSGAASALAGREGIFWIMGKVFIAYLNPWWKPSKYQNDISIKWLNEHKNAFTVLK